MLTIASFYKFVDLSNYKNLRNILLNLCKQEKIKGTILLSQEGINATIAGLNNNINNILNFLTNQIEFADLKPKFSYNNKQPFLRLKVKLKKEIVTMGIPGVSPLKLAGQYIEPKDWNKLISNPDVITIDTRNQYEVHIGSFKNAINPKIDNFREFPEYFNKNFNDLNNNKNQKIAMYCTGGIRCEKSTAYALQLGFKHIYHLKGGILNYLEQIPTKESLWQGECFVFDRRIGVDHKINKGKYHMCYGCRHPISLLDQQSKKYKTGVYCPNCYDTIPKKTIKRAEARQKQIELGQNFSL